MRKNESIEIEKSQEIISNAMDEITRTTKKVLMDYVLRMYHNSLAKAIAFLGVDSLESKDLYNNMDGKQKNIIESIASQYKKTDENVISEVEHILVSVKMNFDNEYKVIKENLLFAGQTSAKEALDNFRSETPIFQKQLDDCIFNFEDLIRLDDRAVRLILCNSEQQELAKALKGASKELKEKVYRNLPERAAAMLQEDMEFMGPVRKCDVEEARAKIVKIVFTLEAEGRIIVRKIKLSDLIF